MYKMQAHMEGVLGLDKEERLAIESLYLLCKKTRDLAIEAERRIPEKYNSKSYLIRVIRNLENMIRTMEVCLLGAVEEEESSTKGNRRDKSQ